MTTSTSEQRDSAAVLKARIDRLPVATATHKRWMVLLAFFFLFDTLDAAMLGYTAPALKAEWGLSISTIGALSSITFAGMMIGAVVGGRLADRVGRRKIILASVVFYSVFSIAAACAPNVGFLGTCRILTGVGLQAMTGVLLVFVSEMYPKHLRGRYQAVLLGLGCIGIPVVSGISSLLIPLGHGMWRWVFVIGGLGVVGSLVGLRILPESVRWQADNGRGAEAELLVARLEDEARRKTGAELPDLVIAKPVPAGAMRNLFSRKYFGRLVVLSICMICFILINYGFNGWVATLLVERGIAQSQALRIAFIISLASVPGSFLAYPIIDRFERRVVGALSMVGVAAFLVVFAFAKSATLLIVSGFLLTALSYVALSVLYTYAPEIFPTNLRGLGAGVGNGMGRVAGLAQGFIVAGIFDAFGFAPVFGYMAAAAVIFAVAMGFFGMRTSNRSLEEV
ncbi:MFS transporter [Amycolatopsis acidicola]|uniref:MFS transporter n=1 Tax=Amycolatopsis acidicola TaxID=2596893 RepID=A0A5N0V613_9PSEU|nr:MFS transporter [Amycolatopsis acidicola]KAA9160563.1 MFS transporter [Amycolatopsis acidicola]